MNWWELPGGRRGNPATQLGGPRLASLEVSPERVDADTGVRSSLVAKAWRSRHSIIVGAACYHESGAAGGGSRRLSGADSPMPFPSVDAHRRGQGTGLQELL